MAADEPPYLTVGTDVSAKYKGAFCEAKITKVNRMVKCKVTFKNNLGSALVPDDQIKGILRIGADVEARHPEKNQFVDAVINKLQDYSQYTVVFDDGDETTLRRTSLCLKSGRHFAESPTLEEFPLTNPEHFGTPVIGSGKSKRKRRSTMNSASLDYDSSDEELHIKKNKISRGKERDPDLGKVVCVEYGDRRKKECWYPGLVVASSLQDNFKINPKEEYFIRSFKDGKYYQVPKKDTREFTPEIGQKVESNTLRTAVEKAMLYYEKEELPPHWDKALYMGLETHSAEEESHDSDSDTPDDEPSEEKDRFVAQLYKFMDERGTPINKAPTVGSRDLNLYKLFKIMHKMGGYNRVTNQNQWKLVYTKMGLPPSNPAGSNQIKVAYKRYLHSFEDFYRKLGCTMVTNSRSTRIRHRSDRNFIITRNRDRDISTSKGKSSNKDNKDKCLGEKKTEEKPKSDEGKKLEVKSKNEEAPKPDEKLKTLEKKKNEKPVRVEEKDEKLKPKKSEEKPRLVRSQSVNKEKKEIKNREDERKELKLEKARTREDARKEKAESPEKKETRSSVKIEQERERKEREETEKKEAEQAKEKKDRLAKEKDKKEEKIIKKEEKQVKEITEEKSRDRKEEKSLKDKKEDKLVREKKEEKPIKDKREEKLVKDKHEEKLPKDKKEERSPKDKKEEKSPKDVYKDRREEKTIKESSKEKKEEKNVKEKKEEKSLKKDEKTPGKFTRDEKISRAENDVKVKEKTPLRDKKETKLVKEKRVFPKEKREEKPIKRESLVQKEKNDMKPQRKEEKDNENESGSPFVEDEVENLGQEDKTVKARNDLDDGQLKQVKKKSIKTEEKEEPKSGLQPNDSDDDDLPLALEKMIDKKDSKEGEIEIGDKVKVKYGRGRMKKLYEAKVLKTDKDGSDRRYYVHYSGWNMRYDEWIRKSSIVENMSEKNRVARKTKQILNAKAQNFLAQVSLKREKGRPPGPLVSSKLSRKSSTSSTNSAVSCSRTTRSDKNSLSTSPYSAGLEPRKRARKKSGLSVALTDTSQDSESDIDHISFDPDDEGDELEDHSNHSEINVKQEVLSDIEGEKETLAGCSNDFKNSSESSRVVNTLCDFKETKMETPFTEEKSPPVLSSIDDHKDSEGAVREEFFKETVPDILETKHDGGNGLKIDLKCEDQTLCGDIGSTENVKKYDDALEKEPVENQVENEDSYGSDICKELDLQQASTSKPSKKCSKLMDSFIDLQQSTVKLLTSKTLTKTLNVAIKDIATEYDFDTWNEISEKKDSVKLHDTLVKESTISISNTESDDDEKMEVSHEYPLTEPESEKEDKFSEDEIKENKISENKGVFESVCVTENKDVFESVHISEIKNTFENENSLTDSNRLEEIGSKEVSVVTDTKCSKNIHEEEETIHCSVSSLDHLDESSKSSSVNALENRDITEDIGEISKPEEIIPVIDLHKYEDLVIIDDSTVERSDEEFKTDNEYDTEDKPHEISNSDGKTCVPYTEVSFPKMVEDKPDTGPDAVPTVEQELTCKQRTESCGLLPTLEIPNSSDDAHDTCTDLPTIDKFAEKDETVHSEGVNIACTGQQLQKQEDCNYNSDDDNENDEEAKPEKCEETCIVESKELEKVALISRTGLSEVCGSESLQTSAVALAAAVATSVATAVPLPSPFSEEGSIHCIPGTSEIVEVVTEVPCEGAEIDKCDKPPERSIEQKFVEVVFQNLEKRGKLEEETTAEQNEVNADVKSCNSMLLFPCNEEKQDLSSEIRNNSIIKESMNSSMSDNDVTKDGTCEAEDLSKPKVCDMTQEKEVTVMQEKNFLPHKIDLNLNADKITIFEEPLLKPLDSNFMRSLGEVADMFLESHNASEASKDSRSDMLAAGSVLKKESKKKKAKLSKQEKKLSGVDFLDREEGKPTKSKSKKKKNEHDDCEKSRDPELKTKSKKLKKNKNKKKLSKHDDVSGDSWKKIDGKDEENTEKVRKKEKRKREEKKISKSDSKNEDSWEVKMLDSSKKEKKKGKKKDRISSEKRAELFEKRAKKKKKLHLEDDSDSEKELRLSRKEKRREKKKVKSKDSSSSDDCADRLVKDLPFEQPENLSSFGSQLIISSTYQREDSVRSDDPDMSFLLCKEKVPASPEDANTVPEDTSNSSVMEENNSLPGQGSSDSEKIEAVVMDSFPRREGLEPSHRHDTEACAVLDNTPPTTPSSTESLLSSSPSHERESYALHYPESTRSGRESGEGESDSLQCEPSGIEVTDSEEYRAAATLAFAVCKSVPEKPKDASRVSLKRQKSECDDLSPTKHRKKSKRHSLPESSKHNHHKSISRNLGGDDDYDSSGANSVTTITSPTHCSSSVQNTSLTPASSQHLMTTQMVTASTPTRPSKFNFYVPLDDYKDADKRIAVIQEKLSELKRTYMSLKAEVALIDRRRKKAKKKEKEAGSAANNPSSHFEEVQCSS